LFVYLNCERRTYEQMIEVSGFRSLAFI